MQNIITILIAILIAMFFVIAFISCLLEALFPKWFWETFESWKAVKEPSKAYFRGKRISGIIGMVIIAVIVAIASAPAFIAYFDK